jgi:predicted Zn-dependent protease
VLAFNRNWVSAMAALGGCKFLTGSIEEAIRLYEQAVRLSPRDPFVGDWHCCIGLVHLLQSRTDQAIMWLKKARGAVPADSSIHAHLASAYALKGETERASAELAEARRLSLDGRFSSVSCLKALDYFGLQANCALYETTYFAGLRKAGMPEA